MPKRAWSRGEARELLSASRSLLRRARKRLQPEKIEEIEGAIATLSAARARRDSEAMSIAAERLDALAERHLAFARKGKTREFAESIGVALLIALILRAFVIEAFQIPSGSMEPTLLTGDRLFVSKFTLGVRVPFTTDYLVRWGGVERGDVMVFVFPSAEVRTQVRLGQIGARLRAWESANGMYPERLEELFEEGNVLSLRPDAIQDAWGNTFEYRSDDESFALWSLGPRGDDVTGSRLNFERSAFQSSNFSCVDQDSLDRNKDYIKRVIGLDGDVVELIDNVWHVNDEPVFQELVGEDTVRPGRRLLALERPDNGREHHVQYSGLQPNFGPVEVQRDHFFAIGDNRDHSSDSRCWGEVPISNIKGRALFLFFSSGSDGIRWERIFRPVR